MAHVQDSVRKKAVLAIEAAIKELETFPDENIERWPDWESEPPPGYPAVGIYPGGEASDRSEQVPWSDKVQMNVQLELFVLRADKDEAQDALEDLRTIVRDHFGNEPHITLGGVVEEVFYTGCDAYELRFNEDTQVEGLLRVSFRVDFLESVPDSSRSQ
jgi:hypothetical protein